MSIMPEPGNDEGLEKADLKKILADLKHASDTEKEEGDDVDVERLLKAVSLVEAVLSHKGQPEEEMHVHISIGNSPLDKVREHLKKGANNE
jgi:hypothetical protein